MSSCQHHQRVKASLKPIAGPSQNALGSRGLDAMVAQLRSVIRHLASQRTKLPVSKIPLIPLCIILFQQLPVFPQGTKKSMQKSAFALSLLLLRLCVLVLKQRTTFQEHMIPMTASTITLLAKSSWDLTVMAPHLQSAETNKTPDAMKRLQRVLWNPSHNLSTSSQQPVYRTIGKLLQSRNVIVKNDLLNDAQIILSW